MACPIYVATKSKWAAIKWSLGSGLFELVGVAIFECLFTTFLTPYVMDFTIAAVAGVMIVLCFTELIPETLENVPSNEAILRDIAWMMLLTLTLTLTLILNVRLF